MSSESDMDFFNLNPQGCLLTDMAGTIRQANPAACLLFGLPQNKLVDIPLVHLIDEADQNVFHCQLTRLRTEKRIEDWEVRLISTQSRPTYAKVVVTTVGNPPGHPEELLWFLCDITAHKETAAKISQHNQQLLTLQFVNAAIASNVDLQNMLDSVSRAMAKVLGVPACAISEWDTETNTVPLLLEYGPDDWWDDDLLEEVYEVADFPATKYVLMERQARQMTINQPNIDPDELRYMQEIKIKTLLMLPMEFQNRVVGLVELMDDRIERTFTNAEIVFVRLLANQAAGTIEYARLYNQIQQELGERILAEEELRQSEARNKALLDAIPDLVIQITRDGRCLNYKGSDSWDLNTVFGVEIGKNVTDLLPPDIADLMLTNINKTLQTGQMQIFEYQLKLPYGSQDYETRMVVNGPDEVIGIIQNITDRKRAEQKAIHEERLAALGQLVATLAHEMNNPLQAVQSHLDLVLNYALDPEKSRLHLNIIRSQIERLHAIMRPVLNLSRPRPTPPQPVVVAQLIEQVLILVDKNLEMNQLQVRTDFQETPLVLVVAEQLTQVFLNLILNAIEAAQPHSQLQIAIFSKDDAVMITFTNHGPLIPSEHMPHIFEPFYTTKSEGSGLGLWVSRNLIQQHGGILTAANLTDDEGVVFSVQLPSASIKELTFLSQSLNGDAGLVQGSRLLVVDDVADIRSGLAHILRLEGYIAEEAASGSEALELLEYSAYDLMLLDMRMPGMHGVEVMTRAREICPDMSIIILTGHATLDSAISAVRLKADNYLLKPISAGELVEIIATTLHERAEKLKQRQLVQVAINTLHHSGPPLLRPTRAPSPERIKVEPLILDLQKWTVINERDPNQIQELSETEAILLSCLMQRPNQVLSCRELAQTAWERDLDEDQAQKLVRPYIFRLRHKIEISPKYPDLIRTVRKRGYLFAARQE